MIVQRTETSLLAAGAMLVAAADDGFWKDKDEAHNWTCVGFALMAAATVQGTIRRSILGNPYDPLDLMADGSRDRFLPLFLRQRRKRRKFAVVGVCLHQLLTRIPRRLSSYQQMTAETPESAEDIMGMLSDRHFYEYFRFTKHHFTELCDYLKIPDYFRCGMQNKQYVFSCHPTLVVPGYRSPSVSFLISRVLHISKQQILFSLLPPLLPSFSPPPTNRHVCEGRLAFMVLLIKMSQARLFSPDLERFFVQSTARLSLFYRAALFHIEENCGHLLDIDREYVKGNLPRFAEAIGDILGMAEPDKSRCWGFIDGTFRPIARPTRYQRSAYNGHYGRHGLKYQGIQRPDGIMHLFGPMAGRRHDAHMLRISGVLEDLRTFSFREELAEPTFYIYGDPAYPQGNKYLQRPFKGAGRTVQQELYNRRWSSVRICGVGFQASLIGFSRPENGMPPKGPPRPSRKPLQSCYSSG